MVPTLGATGRANTNLINLRYLVGYYDKSAIILFANGAVLYISISIFILLPLSVSQFVNIFSPIYVPSIAWNCDIIAYFYDIDLNIYALIY